MNWDKHACATTHAAPSSAALLAPSECAAAQSPPSADDEIVQPSKEWVLPARGKPGRKPSANAPLTKRKAQNRASQRAFRERRNAYVTELEEKVAQYKANEVQANVQLQRIALQSREEANKLREENARLTARIAQLEREHAECERRIAEAAKTSPGCRPPSHERDMRTPVRPSKTDGASAPERAPLKQSPSSHDTTPTPTSDELVGDCGFCPDEQLCVCRGRAKLEVEESSAQQSSLLPRPTRRPSAPLWHVTSAETATPPVATGAASLPLRDRQRPRSKLWPVSPATSPATPGNTFMRSPRRPVALPCSGNPGNCLACGTDPDLAAFCSAVARSRHAPRRAGDSVPRAFERIRSHPNYGQWQGGLDLLASVVARSPPGEHREQEAPGAPRAKRTCAEQASKKIHSPAKKTRCEDAGADGEDAKAGGEAPGRAGGEDASAEGDGDEAVDKALALLDRPDSTKERAEAHGKAENTAPGEANGNANPCPCPWYRSSSRMPWPR